jgi:hypothetical protein
VGQQGAAQAAAEEAMAKAREAEIVRIRGERLAAGDRSADNSEIVRLQLENWELQWRNQELRYYVHNPNQTFPRHTPSVTDPGGNQQPNSPGPNPKAAPGGPEKPYGPGRPAVPQPGPPMRFPDKAGEKKGDKFDKKSDKSDKDDKNDKKSDDKSKNDKSKK